ncbi:MAG: sulfotransferase domain-containing protein [Myxococcota bacterium]|nr:sulfotransferase domain-containing protein [Myxococcota bacterium]
MDERPRLTRIYQNHHLDSTRWRVWAPRSSDVVVTTSYKSGTTLTQQILAQMLYGESQPGHDLSELSVWPDARFHHLSLQDLETKLESTPGRRFLKSHLALDGLPYHEEVRYIVVARDPRDVFMSLLNHYDNYTDEAYRSFNDEERVGNPLPPFPGDARSMWRNWITRGWFPWESEGWPFWGNMHHTQSYWEWRHLPNILFLHYADMRSDHEGAVQKIATFLGHDLDEGNLARIVEASSFETAKKRAIAYDQEQSEEPRQFRGGEAAFIHKGTNGRWKDILSEEDLELYEETKRRVLTPDCAAWLEQGSEVL